MRGYSKYKVIQNKPKLNNTKQSFYTTKSEVTEIRSGGIAIPYGDNETLQKLVKSVKI